MAGCSCHRHLAGWLQLSQTAASWLPVTRQASEVQSCLRSDCCSSPVCCARRAHVRNIKSLWWSQSGPRRGAGAGLEWEIKRVAGPVFQLQPPPARCQLLFIATDLSPRVSFLHPPATSATQQSSGFFSIIGLFMLTISVILNESSRPHQKCAAVKLTPSC